MRLTASPGPPGLDGRGTPESDPVDGVEVVKDTATGEVLVGDTDAAIGEVIVDATAADLVGAVVAVATDCSGSSRGGYKITNGRR